LKTLHIGTLAEPRYQRTREAIKDVNEFFKKLKLESLRDLRILWSKSTTNSIFKILINRHGCPSLERISIIGCRNLKITYLEFNQFVKSCPNLKYVFLDTSSVSEISSEFLQEIDQKISLKVSGDDDYWMSIDEHINQRLKGNDHS